MKCTRKHLALGVFLLPLLVALVLGFIHAGDLATVCHSWLTQMDFGVLIVYVGLSVLALFAIYLPLCWKLSPDSLKKFLDEPGSFSTAVVGLAATAVFGWLSYQTSRQASQMTLRNELYANERWWYDACAENPHLYAWVAQVKPDTSPKEYVRLCLEATSKGLTFAPKNVHELKSYLWDADQFHKDGEHQQRLRRQYDVMDLVFYHLERVYSYTSSEFRPMSEEEANTWLGLLKNVGPNPLLLVAILDAHEYGYINADFAEWVQRTFRKHEHAAVVAYFYPELLEDSWLNDIKAIQGNKVLYRAEVAPDWETPIKTRMERVGLEWTRNTRAKGERVPVRPSAPADTPPKSVPPEPARSAPPVPVVPPMPKPTTESR